MKKYVIQKSEMGLVFKNEVLRRIVTKVKTYRFLQAEMLIINKKDYLPLKEMTVAELESLKENDLSVDYLIPTGFQGILYVDGVFKEMLESGRHWFITVDKKVEVKTIDVRKRTIHVNAQEILTTDKIDLRVNFAVSFNVVDAKKALTEYDKFDDALYLLCQLVIREYISSKTMDEILEEKASLGEKLLAILRPKEKEYGIAFIDAGLKDVILPGDIKAILNTVLVAQKQAQANVITRREETASTRSLLNTAKLLDENKTLYRLKELEYLEKILQNVSHISLGTGTNALDQLSQIVNKIDDLK